jgi:predicted Rossmann-fold nucleotide-binding protein
MRYCQAFVVLPGGCGTIGELFVALTLVARPARSPGSPVVLAGSGY